MAVTDKQRDIVRELALIIQDNMNKIDGLSQPEAAMLFVHEFMKDGYMWLADFDVEHDQLARPFMHDIDKRLGLGEFWADD